MALLINSLVLFSQTWTTGTGLIYINPTTTKVGIGTSTPSTPLSFGTSLNSTILALYDNATTWYGFGIQNNQMRLQIGSTSAKFSFLAGSTTEIFTINGNGAINATGAITATSLSTGTGAITAGAITAASLSTGTGSIIAGSINTSGTIKAGIWNLVNSNDFNISTAGGNYAAPAFLTLGGYSGSTGGSVTLYAGQGMGTCGNINLVITNPGVIRLGAANIGATVASDGSYSTTGTLTAKSLTTTGAISAGSLTTTGNVNIGCSTTSTTANLHVNGVINATEVDVITSVPCSDYVFEPGYMLKSLPEIECYVKENKHLPDVPSANEFKEKGCNVGQMQDLLLKKVEELTLYVIELKKENDALKAKVDGLTK